MDIHETEQQSGRKLDETFFRSLDRERNDAQALAHILSRNAELQWRKTIEGAVALPAAIATNVAAIALRTVAFVTSCMEAIQQSAQRDRALFDAEDNRRGGRNFGYEQRDRLNPSDEQQQHRSMEIPQHS